MQKHNPYIHPIRAKLLQIFNIKPTLANLQRRKHIKQLINEQELIIAKWETYLNTTRQEEDWFVNDKIKEAQQLKAKLEKKLHLLKVEYKRLKNTSHTTNTTDQSSTQQKPTFIEYDKEAIRRIPISDILKQFGHEPKQTMQGREKYLCIFHNEKTPSLVVNLDANYAHCFGCDKSADVIEIYQKLAGVDFITSLKELNDYV